MLSRAPPLHTPTLLTTRWVLVLAAACGELATTGSLLRVPEFTLLGGEAARFLATATDYISVGGIGAFLVASLATFLLVVSRRLPAVTGALEGHPGYRWWGWLGLQVTAFSVFLLVSWPVFGPDPDSPALTWTWLASWVGAGITAVLGLLLAIAPASAWQRFARQERQSASIAAFAGIAAWAGGKLAQVLWLPLTELTLWCTYQLLTLGYRDVFVDPERAILAVNSFSVEIAPACSGYEGIALITVFVSLYLWLFRQELTFPKALILYPVGILVIWIANVFRIAALVAIGASVSADVAVDGFHSQAGWIGFSVVALGVIALAHRYLLVVQPDAPSGRNEDYFRPASALVAPLLVLMGTSMLVAALSSGFQALYPLTVLVTMAALWRFRGHYASIPRGVAWQAVAIGAVIGLAWLALVGEGGVADSPLPALLAQMPAWLAAGWVGFRVIGSVVTVPIAEELAFRGYLIRKLVANDFEKVTPGTFTLLSFTVSSVAFGLLHDSWAAGTLAGAGYAGALYWRGRITDAVVAHMTSNALIAVAVLGGGWWNLWG